MRTFHILAYDQILEGTGTTYTDPQLQPTFGSADLLRLFAVAEQVTVTSGTPTLTVQLEESADRVMWSNKTGTAEINAVTLSTTAVTMARGFDNGSTPNSGFIRMRLTLGGTNPRARVKLWVTGRTERL